MIRPFKEFIHKLIRTGIYLDSWEFFDKPGQASGKPGQRMRTI